MFWDYVESNPFSGATGSVANALDSITDVLTSSLPHGNQSQASVASSSATNSPLADDMAAALFTDPPYYDAVPYADLSDFFYVWLKRSVGSKEKHLFSTELTPKRGEIVQLAERNTDYSYKTKESFELLMKESLVEARRVVQPTGIGVIVFAHQTTIGWETMLSAVINSGWVVTASWPIDTEFGGRLRAMNSAVLASSVHLVCRPREEGQNASQVGDWRDVLDELPRRIHSWMPRLGDEGIVGADAIFACLGPALEIFSRYSRVEKANGEVVGLTDYLEYVWAAVAKEALAMVFRGADASGFEGDARLTAIWLWTLSTGSTETIEPALNGAIDGEEGANVATPKGYVLEYDAARKLAQGLGARLEALTSIIEVGGKTARLLPVAERTRNLLGKDNDNPVSTRKKKSLQLPLGFVEELERVEVSGVWGTKGVPELGTTVLDRVHQCMILFAASRGEALRRFLVDEGVGRDERFWRLAQVLSFLYPKASDEKRWIDGVLARKKGLGL